MLLIRNSRWFPNQDKVCRYQRGNQKPPINEGQTLQWPKKKNKRTNNDLQNTTQETKDWVTLTPLKIEGERGGSGKVSRSCFTCDIRHVTVRQHEHHLIWKSRTYQGWTLELEASTTSLYKVSDTGSYHPLIFLILFQV